MTKTISKKEAAELIMNSNGTIFTVDFIKRSTMELRVMRARLGPTVKKGLAGGKAPYNFMEKGLIPAYLMAGDENKAITETDRRTIPIEGIVNLSISGTHYKVI